MHFINLTDLIGRSVLVNLDTVTDMYESPKQTRPSLTQIAALGDAAGQACTVIRYTGPDGGGAINWVKENLTDIQQRIKTVGWEVM